MHPGNQHSLKEVLQEMTEAPEWREKLQLTKIRQLWSQQMGTTINQYTQEINLRKGTLFITITAASLKQELSFGKEKIQKMLNAELGEACIREVVVR